MDVTDDDKPPVGHLGRGHRLVTYVALLGFLATAMVGLGRYALITAGAAALSFGTMAIRFRRDPLRHWLFGSKFALWWERRDYDGVEDRVVLGLLTTRSGSILVGLGFTLVGAVMFALAVLGVGEMPPLV